MATLLEQVNAGAGPQSGVVGRNPWALAARRLRRNRIALAALGLFLLIVVMCLAAPLYANNVAHLNPFPPNLNGHTVVNGTVVPVMQQGGGTLHLGETPIGPTWDPGHYFLGADSVGRDVAALLHHRDHRPVHHRVAVQVGRERVHVRHVVRVQRRGQA